MTFLSFVRMLYRHGRPAGQVVVALAVLCGLGFGGAQPGGQGRSSHADDLDSLAAVRADTIKEVRADLNEDAVPERVGDTVLVQGRAVVQRGALPDSALIFIQDATAGFAVHLPDGPNVRRGDSLVVRGVVEHRYGLTRVRAFSYERVEAMTSIPAPVPLTVTAADGEPYEGRLVRVRGRVIVNRTNDGGQYLLLEDEAENAEARLAVFVPRRRLDQISLDGFESGELVTVTGILSQHDVSAPYDAGYQVLPRDQADLERIGFLAGYYPTIIILVIAGGLLAIMAVFTLRAAVRRRTQQLVESRARFRRLSEATFEGILLHRDGQILDVNRAFTEMSGYDHDELLGRTFEDLLSESTSHLVPDAIPQGEHDPYEAVMVRKDGSSFPAEVEEKVVKEADRDVRVVALRNVTERKKRETELLLAKEEAEQMARLKSSLLNNMSHELRTPVTSIIGYAEVILEEPGGDHTEFAERIRQSGKRLSRTLQDVLDMAQLESGTLSVEEEDVRIEALVHGVAEEYRPLARESGLALDVDVQTAEPLCTDRTLLRRSLSNLVHNAVKFTSEGRVAVEAKPVDSGVRLFVSDTGIGIGAEFRPHLFEPFKQESEGRARTHEGTGLGLALTKRMIELLGGTIQVESTKGDGSTFVIEVPPMFAKDEAPLSVADREVVR
jgi:PAS domain S-box-containing protein